MKRKKKKTFSPFTAIVRSNFVLLTIQKHGKYNNNKMSLGVYNYCRCICSEMKNEMNNKMILLSMLIHILLSHSIKFHRTIHICRQAYIRVQVWCERKSTEECEEGMWNKANQNRNRQRYESYWHKSFQFPQKNGMIRLPTSMVSLVSFQKRYFFIKIE